jgi:prepilin-type N-terminal cleavage/methylation domain-containing protein
MNAWRGFTLIELMISITVMLFAIVAASTVIVTAGTMTRNADNASDDFDHARLAGEILTRDIQSAGLMTPGGVFIGATTSQNFPLWGEDGNGTGAAPPAPVSPGTDDLWIIVSDRNALRNPCVDMGAALPIQTAVASGPLTVQCSTGNLANAFNTTDFLVAANSRTGALLTVTGLAFPTISYAEQGVPNFSDAPPPGSGFSVGDMVYHATPWHYFVKVIPAIGSQVAWSGLYRHRGLVAADPLGRPLSDDPVYNDELVQVGVEDLQVAYGFDATNTGDPAQYTYGTPTGAPTDYSLPPGFNAATPIRTVRLTVVARSQQSRHETGGSQQQVQSSGLGAGGGLQVENHLIPADGFQRAVYSRRLELPNLTPIAL